MKYLSMLLLLLCPTVSAAELEVDISEVLRRGDMVEHINGLRQHISDIHSDNIAQAMQMPANDNDKWFISIVGTERCVTCENLKKDWKTNQYLRSLATPGDAENSWAHITFYKVEDASQSWRWNRIEFRKFPTIIVQPPRNGDYGPVKDIVFFQAGYSGSGEKLSGKMIDAIKLRISKFPIVNTARDPPVTEVIGVDPPWNTDPEPRPRLPFRVPDVPPIETPVPFPGWTIPALLSGGPLMWLAIGGLAFWAFTRVRQWRIDQGKKPVIDEDTMAFLVNLAKQFDIVQDDDEEEEEETPEPKKRRTVRRKSK